MAQPYIGEVRLFAGNFAPAGWMFCDGQLLAISENETLFQLIGTTYGGDGQATFALPDLRSRVPIHMGQGAGLSNYIISEAAGIEQVTLTVTQIPNHTHAALCRSGAGQTSSNPANGTWTNSDVNQYSSAAATGGMGASETIITSPVGGSQPHENMIPFLCIHYIISLFGIFPSQT